MLFGRRVWIQFCVVLSIATIFIVSAKIVFASMISLAVFFLTIGIIALWIAFVRLLNAMSAHLPQTVAKVIHWIHAQTIEMMAFGMLIFLRLATLFRKNQPSLNGTYERPILLVHGYLNAGFVWDFHKNQLIKNGFGPIYTLNLGYPFHSIDTYAKKVQKKAKLIAQETGRSDLTLIGHSMGGLVSYYYASKLAQAYTVPQVITIASPLKGTRVAKIGLGRCAREMQINSDLLNDLKESIECCSDVKFYNIATQTDELVIPYTSSLFTTDPTHQFVVDDIGHASLLFSERVSNQLCQWLHDV